MPALVRLIISSLQNSQTLAIVVKFYLSFYSFWNLDLFRSFIPDICLNISTLQALALDYLLAVYPFVLILLSYFFIELYDRKVSCIVTIWKPFHRMLSSFRRSWNTRTSVIDSFATFFLLSYTKIISVTIDILVPTRIYELGSNSTRLGLYYSPTVPYFHSEHLPYAILALVLLTVFVSIPTSILILYPSPFFQRFLSLFPLNWHSLHAFVDSFQGCYKDGTEPGTFDCRWFSTSALLIRLLFFIIYGLTLSSMFFVYATIILVVYLTAIINIQPFKKVAARYPSTDTVFITLLSFFYVVILGRDIADRQRYFFTTPVFVVFGLSAFVPIIYTLYIHCVL